MTSIREVFTFIYDNFSTIDTSQDKKVDSTEFSTWLKNSKPSVDIVVLQTVFNHFSKDDKFLTKPEIVAETYIAPESAATKKNMENYLYSLGRTTSSTGVPLTEQGSQSDIRTQEGIYFILENMTNPKVFKLEKPVKSTYTLPRIPRAPERFQPSSKPRDQWIQTGTYIHPETKKESKVKIVHTDDTMTITLNNYHKDRPLELKFSYNNLGRSEATRTIEAKLINPKDKEPESSFRIGNGPGDKDPKNRGYNFELATQELRKQFNIPELDSRRSLN